ncbi:MAG: M48 family metallopeptidase [Kineosporiaceae bacterium]
MLVKMRLALALLVLAAFPLVVLAVAAAIVAGGVRLAALQGGLGTRIVIGGLIVAAGLVGGAVNAFRARPEPAQGVELTRQGEPRLWQLLDSLAAPMGVRGPDRLVVVPEVNARVSEVGGHREMVLGLPLLAGLTRTELASVLAHELGHYAQGHTRLGALTYRWSVLIEGVLDRMSSAVVRGLLTAYYSVYVLLTASARRQQELQADDWSVRLTDPVTAGSAMTRVGQIDLGWERLIEDYLPLTGPAHRRASLAVGLRELMRADPVPPDVAALADTGRPRSRFDSHPRPANAWRDSPAQPTPAAPWQPPTGWRPRICCTGVTPVWTGSSNNCWRTTTRAPSGRRW